MTAELWLKKPCPHGSLGTCDAVTHGALGRYCEGGLQVRLDPEQTFAFKPDPDRMGETIVYLDVKDVIEAVKDVYDDALTKQETDQ